MSRSYRVSEIAILNKSSLKGKNDLNFINYLDTGNLTRNSIDEVQYLENAFPSRAKRLVDRDTILYSTVRPNQEHYGFFENIAFENFVVSTGFTTINVVSPYVLPKYLYYCLIQKSVINHLQSIAENSVSSYPSIKPEDIGNLRFDFPDIETQKRIVNILSNLDNKIALNNQINQELEEMAKTFYDYWFVQFDFPDENGNPYKSSGGKMVYNETLKREIPEGWGVKKLGDLDIVTGKRDANFGVENGRYDFWTTANTPIKANEYSFEGKAILIAGNGNFYVNFTDGKFEAYQRTYVIQSTSENDLKLMYMACLQSIEKLRRRSNGSIIKFITIGDVQNISQAYNSDVVFEFIKQFSPMLEQLQHNKRQIGELTKHRDWLLPMLMTGQVRIDY